MAKMYPLLNSWSAGEITPRIHVRPDLGAYQNGAKRLENFIATSHGPVERRSGFRFVSQQTAGDGRIFAFSVNQGTNFLVGALDDGTLYVNDPSGRPLDPTAELVTNPSFNDGGTGWTSTSPGNASVVFGQGFVDLNAGNQFAAIDQQLTTTDPTLEHIFRARIVSDDDTVDISIGTTQGASDILSATVSGEDINLPFTPGAGNASFWIRIENNTGGTTVTVDVVSVLDPSVIASDVTFPHPWDINDINALQVAMPAGEYAMYFVTPTTQPYKLTYDPATELWAFAAVAFTSPPSQWTGTNWPGTITFFQNRMWLGGTPNEPETFWASKSNAYEDFTFGTGSNADDAFEFSLNFRGAIKWMAGVRNLLIGTENAEYIVTSQEGVVKAGDIQVEQQSSFTSASVQPIQIGNNVIYVSADRRKVRDIGYQWTDEQWVSRDITFMSEHITAGQRRAAEIEWAQNPDNLMWLSTGDGSLLGVTYERTYEVIGWHPHTTDGEILSIATYEGFGRSQLWALVKRDSVPGELYLEHYDEGVFLDSFVEIVGVSPFDTIEVPHLANKTVGVLADGAVHPDVTLDGSGNGTLDYEVNSCIVGLNYTSTLETMPIDSNTGQGMLRSRQERWSRIFVSLVDSHDPIINGVRPPTRYPATPMDTKDPPRTDYVRVANLGYDRDATVIIEQDLPLSCVVNGIFGELGEGTL